MASIYNYMEFIRIIPNISYLSTSTLLIILITIALGTLSTDPGSVNRVPRAIT